jgi:hypothetical protein
MHKSLERHIKTDGEYCITGEKWFASGGSDVVQKIFETRQSHFSKVTDGEAASV